MALSPQGDAGGHRRERRRFGRLFGSNLACERRLGRVDLLAQRLGRLELRLGRVGTSIVLDTGRFALALVAQIFGRDAHKSQGFPDPGGAEFEYDRNFFPCSRVLGIEVRHRYLFRGVRAGITFPSIGVRNRYYGEEVCFLEATGC